VVRFRPWAPCYLALVLGEAKAARPSPKHASRDKHQARW
jgi:hypothetical protein